MEGHTRMDWKQKSIGGNEVLIKSVAQARPTYATGCFKLRDGFVNILMVWLENFGGVQRRDKGK